MRCTFQIDTSTHLRVPFSMGLWVPVLYHVSLNHLSITSHQTSLECERSALWRKDILGLMRLDKRRDRSDVIKTFKILNGNYKVDKDLFFVPDDGGWRGHSRKLFKRLCRLRLANHPGMAGIVPELTHGVPCPGRGSFCPGNVKIDHRAWIYGCSLMTVLYFVLCLSVTHDLTWLECNVTD